MSTKRFIIRNYGQTRTLPYKGQNVTVNRDKVIETDDAEMAALFGAYDRIHVTEHTGEPQVTSRAVIVQTEKEQQAAKQENKDVEATEPDETSESKDEIGYDEMSFQELKLLVEDRQLTDKIQGKLSIEKCVKALKDNDFEMLKQIDSTETTNMTPNDK